MKVFINPGHARNGEPDPGAVNSFYKFRECDIACSIGELIQSFLFRAGCQVHRLQSHNLNGEAPEYGKIMMYRQQDIAAAIARGVTDYWQKISTRK